MLLNNPYTSTRKTNTDCNQRTFPSVISNTSQSIDVQTYSDEEFYSYTDYMDYVLQLVNESDIPNDIKKKMIDGRDLKTKSNNTIWFMQYNGYVVQFMPFRSWLKMVSRSEKLDELLNECKA